MSPDIGEAIAVFQHTGPLRKPCPHCGANLDRVGVRAVAMLAPALENRPELDTRNA